MRKEKRKYLRYGTEMKVCYRINYDIRTKVRFRILEDKEKLAFKRYSGVSDNISIKGLCFSTRKKLEKKDMLLLEVYPPAMKNPVCMEGEVRWCEKKTKKLRNENLYYVGVKLISVEGKTVSRSTHYDKEYKIMWGAVLEALFGNFKEMAKAIRAKKKNTRVKASF